jgi:GxxExxY protein
MRDDSVVGLNEISERIIGAAIEVHKQLGPGLLESVYEAREAEELSLRGIKYQAQVALPVIYKGVRLSADFRADLIVEDKIVVELKAAEKTPPRS